MFAVIELAGKQYKVKESNTLEISRIDGNAGDAVKIDRVMLVYDGKKTYIGTPYLDKANVKAKILSQVRGEKIDVRRYKSKVRYRKHIGFRPEITKIEITSIGLK